MEQLAVHRTFRFLRRSLGRKILAFAIAPLSGASCLALVAVLSASGTSAIGWYIIFVFIFSTFLFATVIYYLTLLFVLPVYLILLFTKTFNRYSITLVGVIVGGLSSLIFRNDPNQVWLLTLMGVLVGLVCGLVFFQVHGPLRGSSSQDRMT